MKIVNEDLVNVECKVVTTVETSTYIKYISDVLIFVFEINQSPLSVSQTLENNYSLYF